jgi:hypothetical protein
MALAPDWIGFSALRESFDLRLAAILATAWFQLGAGAGTNGESRFCKSEQTAAVGRSRTFRPQGLRAKESVARHCPNEALHFGLVVVVVHAGGGRASSSARGQIERGERDTWDVVFIAERRSRVLPGASPSM